MIIWYERLNPNIEEPTTYLIHGGLRDGQIITEAEYHAIGNKAGTGMNTGLFYWPVEPLRGFIITAQAPKEDNGDPLL